jgi:taurine dioxygenase
MSVTLAPKSSLTEGFVDFRIVSYSPNIGAEVLDIDLTLPLSKAVVAALHNAFIRYQVLFFRDQRVSLEDLTRIAGHFGSLHMHVGVNPTSKPTDNALVRKLHYDETSTRVSGEDFHSDQSCAIIPPLGSLLYNHTVPKNGGGDTIFTSMYAAYEALSPGMQTYLEGLSAVHDGTRVFGSGSPISTHPLIVRHPESGRKLIFVNSFFTSKIVGVSKLESDRVLAFLYEHCAKPDWSCRFMWRDHSIALWDNRCTQHRAIWDYWPNIRSGYRVQIEGTEAPTAA